jgi:hypothetical protein
MLLYSTIVATKFVKIIIIIFFKMLIYTKKNNQVYIHDLANKVTNQYSNNCALSIDYVVNSINNSTNQFYTYDTLALMLSVWTIDRVNHTMSYFNHYLHKKLKDYSFTGFYNIDDTRFILLSRSNAIIVYISKTCSRILECNFHISILDRCLYMKVR